MRRIACVLGCVGLVAACEKPPAGQGLRVTVTLAASTRSTCVKVMVDGAQVHQSVSVPVNGASQFEVAVLQGALPDDVTVQAVGFSDAACTALTAPSERSEAVAARFVTDSVRWVPVLVRQLSGVDADNDGSPVELDCDDKNPMRTPGRAEDCADGVDNDCNMLIDCVDPVCEAKACAPGVPAEQAACVVFSCAEKRCDNHLDDDRDTRLDCEDADCDGKACLNGGHCAARVCLNATSEVGLCGDGDDNDNDGLVDCLDSDCLAQQCNDQLTCSEHEVCLADKTCGSGTTVGCVAPSACFANGVCREGPNGSGGCTFSVVTAGPCDDFKACTTNDVCAGDGGCAGSPVTCDQPPGICFAPVGTCQESLDGGCTYEVLRGLCDDGKACTSSDACNPDGGCGGIDVVCVPNECQMNGACAEATGGCTYTPKTGQPCSLGVCDSQGQCMAIIDGGTDAGTSRADAGFVPSNFDPSQVPVTSVNAVFTCDATVTIGDTTVTIAGAKRGCTPPTIPTAAVPQAGGTTAALLAMSSLVINPGVTVRVVGTRPVIFAVLGTATLEGNINVSAVDSSSSGPGGNTDNFCLSNRGTPGSGSNAPTGGGGGGAYGTSGASGGVGTGSTTNAGVGASANGNDELIPLRGGCAGGNGGSLAGGFLGRAGGALQITAFGVLSLNGQLASSGSPGLGGFGFQAGGGGGGSGGGILLESPRVTVGAAARITANGGGGGAGATNRSGGSGEGGTATGTPALGGTGPACGGAGGQGAAILGAAAAGEAGGGTGCGATGGGGGGGGGMGRIRVNASQGCSLAPAAVFSPASTSAQVSCVH